jgi:3-deoxy-manno-octulosonate cytidylyltransferase (CMP-KDO synthetase)
MRTGITCVVPARLGSTRFFGKLLTPIFGKPVIVHTLERAVGAGCFNRVVCLTDSPEIGEAVAASGFQWVLSGDAANGTDRIARSLDRLDADLIVNLQGDEPAFPEEGLHTLCAALTREPHAVHLLVHENEPTADDIANPNRVKTIVDENGLVIGFFRGIGTSIHRPVIERRTEPVEVWPAEGGLYRDAGRHSATDAPRYRLQLGAYAYPRAYLEQYAALPPSRDEIALSHEMLRAPALAPLRAHTLQSKHHGASVDVPEDVALAEHALKALSDSTRHTGPTAQSAPEKPAQKELQPTRQGATP